MDMKLMWPASLLLILFTQSAFCEELKYILELNYGDMACISGENNKFENKRRETITTYNLPKNLQWKYGETVNEWGDTKENFCSLVYGNKAYIYRPFHLIFLSDKPIEVIRLDSR